MTIDAESPSTPAGQSTPGETARHAPVVLLVALGCVSYLAIAGAIVAIAFLGVRAYLAAAPALLVGPSMSTARLDRPSAAISSYIAREYPDYEVLDSYALARDPYSNLPGATFLLSSRTGTFPATLMVGVWEGELSDIPASQRDTYTENAGYVTDDASFSASMRTANGFTAADMAEMGRAFRARTPGPNAIVTFSTFDSEFRFITFGIAGNAPRNPTFAKGGLEPTHIGQLFEDEEGSHWTIEVDAK